MRDIGLLPETFPHPQHVVAFSTASSKEMEEEEDPVIAALCEEFSDVFDDSIITPMKGEPLTIKMRTEDPDYKPKQTTVPRKPPSAYKEAAADELSTLLGSNVIERVPPNETPSWVSPGMWVPKPASGKARLVVDFGDVNKHVERPVHPFPSVQDCIQDIDPNSKWFLVFDCLSGYHQIELDPESRQYTTFILPEGKFRYCRAPMGLRHAGDGFCVRTDLSFAEIKKLKKMVDDGLLQGKTKQEVYDQFRHVLVCCRRDHIQLSRKKLQFGKSVRFAGFIISENSIKSDPKKISALVDFPQPKDLKQLRSFLGLANQLAGFVPDYAQHAKPLNDMLKKSSAFVWFDSQEKAFASIKRILSTNTVIRPFDPERTAYLYTDASRINGIGFALMQSHADADGVNRLKIVQCGSRSLKGPETRYATNELEMLAIVYAIQKCRYHLLGRKFVVVTDHKPLVGTMSKPLWDIGNQRLQRFREKVMDYVFETIYIKGKDNVIADALSRQPLFDSEDAEELEDDNEDEQVTAYFCVAAAFREPMVGVEKDVLLHNINKFADEDPSYQQIIHAFRNDKDPRDLHPDHPAKAYQSVWPQISQWDHLLILDSSRIIVPRSARTYIMQLVHKAHVGSSRTVRLARDYYYWPNMKKDIEELVSLCDKCQYSRASQYETPQRFQPAQQPMHSLSLDLFKANGRDHLVVVDRFSLFNWVFRFNNRTTQEVVLKMLWTIWKDFGYPLHILSDGGPQFTDQFTADMAELGIFHERSSPYHSRGNGLAESTVASMKRLVEKSDSWKDFEERHLIWKCTPSSQSDSSPADVFFNRRLRFGLPHISPLSKDFNPTITPQRRLPALAPGTRVRIQGGRTGKWEDFGKIFSTVRGNDQKYMVLRDRDDAYITRTRSMLKPITEVQQSDATSESTTRPTPLQPEPERPRRSTRITQSVKPYQAGGF